MTVLATLCVAVGLAWGAWGGRDHPVPGTPHLGTMVGLALLALLAVYAFGGHGRPGGTG